MKILLGLRFPSRSRPPVGEPDDVGARVTPSQDMAGLHILQGNNNIGLLFDEPDDQVDIRLLVLLLSQASNLPPIPTSPLLGCNDEVAFHGALAELINLILEIDKLRIITPTGWSRGLFLDLIKPLSKILDDIT